MVFDKRQNAKTLGLIKTGWRFTDYCLFGKDREEWIASSIIGIKGAGKSNAMLQHGYTMFHGYDEFDEFNRGSVTNWSDMSAWEKVLRYICYRREDFARVLSEAKKSSRPIPWTGWDDIGIHLSTALYSMHREEWDAMQTCWNGIRGEISVFECTAPRKDDIVGFIRRDCPWSMTAISRSRVRINYWYTDESLKDRTQEYDFRIDMQNEPLNIYNVPSEIWTRYKERTQELRHESTDIMIEKLLSLGSPEPSPIAKNKVKYCEGCKRWFNEANFLTHKCKGTSPPPISN